MKIVVRREVTQLLICMRPEYYKCPRLDIRLDLFKLIFFSIFNPIFLYTRPRIPQYLGFRSVFPSGRRKLGMCKSIWSIPTTGNAFYICNITYDNIQISRRFSKAGLAIHSDDTAINLVQQKTSKSSLSTDHWLPYNFALRILISRSDINDYLTIVQ